MRLFTYTLPVGSRLRSCTQDSTMISLVDFDYMHDFVRHSGTWSACHTLCGQSNKLFYCTSHTKLYSSKSQCDQTHLFLKVCVSNVQGSNKGRSQGRFLFFFWNHFRLFPNPWVKGQKWVCLTLWWRSLATLNVRKFVKRLLCGTQERLRSLSSAFMDSVVKQTYRFLWWLCDASWRWMVGPWILSFAATPFTQLLVLKTERS